MHRIFAKSWLIANVKPAITELCGQILAQAKQQGFDDEGIFAIHLSLEEAFMNALKHGNQGDPTKTISVDCLITDEKFDISIADQGSGFRPDDVPDPRRCENLLKCSGRGVLLIKAYMNIVEYNDRGNCVHMVKFRNKPDPHEIGHAPS